MLGPLFGIVNPLLLQEDDASTKSRQLLVIRRPPAEPPSDKLLPRLPQVHQLLRLPELEGD